ncbi:serine hydrolase domain-containing protein [Candidatus Poriferisodalis sp.]|uniref:serine hydrolase domain-containing protein n=1 Tax=Candidatus Poriferisodalis sp. TaxID=3101277 RepID=UPI003B027CA1
MASSTPDIEPTVDPADVGFDAGRLERIAAHLDRYVDDGRLPGVSVLLTRGGQIAYTHRYGERDCERSLPVTSDTIYRIYSMTKPIVSIAAMQLYEQGCFQLKDPVSRWIPEFANARVFAGGNVMQYQTREPASEVTVHSLLTHTSGLTYDFHFANEVDALYRANGFNWGAPGNLEETCEALASLPLLFDPGTEWNYSYSTDVLGRVVELVSGQSLDEYLVEHVTGPLGMVDTGFEVPAADVERFAANYTTATLAAREAAGNTGPTVPAYRPDDPGLQRTLMDDPRTSAYLGPPKILSGGGGLVSTMGDYHRFTQMLRNGGELDGARVIGRRTLEFMASNHLPGGTDLTECGRALFSEAAFDGVGFGLGFSVVLDPAKAKVVSSKGEFAWGGAASTAFWVDPVEDITLVFLTQLLPSSVHPIRPELKALVYQALV